MQLATRLSQFEPSATLAINAKALELKAQGVKVTSLAVGEPDFPTPRHICEAAKAAIDAGYFKYTDVAGILELRKAVTGYYRRLYGVNADPQQVLVGNGGKQVLYNLMLALLNPGDEVIIPAPYWLSYPDMVRLAGATPVSAAAAASQGFKITIAQLEACLSPQSKALILNSPSNPTGVAYTRSELDTIMAWAMERQLFVIADEIYDQLVYAPAKPCSVADWWERFPDRVAVVNGLSKTFAMTGWRVGYTLATPELIKGMVKIQGQTTSNVCSIAQRAAVAALEGSYDDVDTMRTAFMRRRDMAWEEISRWPGVVCPKPDGAFYLFLDVRELLRKAEKTAPVLCAYLLETAHVATVPGDVFGDSHCIRLSYAVGDDELMAALGRMHDALYR